MVFDIEPVFLEAEELVIRNVIDSALTPRERTSKLNWLFKQEKQGKRPPPGEHAFPYSAAIDLAQCENTIDALNNIVSTEPVSADGTRRAYARISHVNLRLLRIVTDDAEELKLNRLKAICETLNALNLWKLFDLSAKPKSLTKHTTSSETDNTFNVDTTIGNISDEQEDTEGAQCIPHNTGTIPKTNQAKSDT